MLEPQKIRDLDTAYNIHYEMNCLGVTENAIVPKRKDENYKPKTLIDHTLELIDPTPNIYTLFVQFNTRFFRNVLLPVEVKWSNRMTSCAGICTFHPKNRQCVISLSAPLLKLRPRKDLVETLLHEMIHGYLFLTNNNRDRDGHGPEFCKHMHRINKEAGTNITIYHDFHDEVKLYKQHWWKCNGPCRNKAPYFGTVRRAMNRAPGPSDFWWKEHERNCGGQFIKIKEPEKNDVNNLKNNKTKHPQKNSSCGKNILDWLTKGESSSSLPKKNNKTMIVPKKVDTNKDVFNKDNMLNKEYNTNSLTEIKKLGNGMNNVHGWGTAGPGNNHSNLKVPVSVTPKFSVSSSLGGNKSGRSNLLDKFYDRKNNDCEKNKTIIQSKESFVEKKDQCPLQENNLKSLEQRNNKYISCPVCNTFISHAEINVHLDTCLTRENRQIDKSRESPNTKFVEQKFALSTDQSEGSKEWINSKRKNSPNLINKSNKQAKIKITDTSKLVNCPVCEEHFEFININNHLDKCLPGTSDQAGDRIISNDSEVLSNIEVLISSPSNSDSSDCIIIDSPSASNDHLKRTNHNGTHHCLICNAVITPEISLNNHLEECIESVFNDSSTSFSDEKISNTTQDTGDNKIEYPCPVCMKWLPETLMNQHLDSCLEDN